MDQDAREKQTTLVYGMEGEMIAPGRWEFDDDWNPIPVDDVARSYVKEHGVTGVLFPVWVRENNKDADKKRSESQVS